MILQTIWLHISNVPVLRSASLKINFLIQANTGGISEGFNSYNTGKTVTSPLKYLNFKV